MAHYQRNEPDMARHWYDKGTEWMIGRNPDNLLKRLQSEAETLVVEATGKQ
jgi:hypothetical protein